MPDVCDGVPDFRRNKASAPSATICRRSARLRTEVGGIHPEKPVRYRELPWCRIMAVTGAFRPCAGHVLPEVVFVRIEEQLRLIGEPHRNSVAFEPDVGDGLARVFVLHIVGDLLRNQLHRDAVGTLDVGPCTVLRKHDFIAVVEPHLVGEEVRRRSKRMRSTRSFA